MLGLTILTMLLAPQAWAQTVTLAWNANGEPDLAGYIVQYGTQSGNPGTNVDVGNVISRQFTGLQAGVTYYFRVLAYNSSAQQSGPSNEVAYTIAAPAPAPTISGVSPGSGSTAGGTLLTVNGANFVSGATVRVGGVSATGVTVLSAAQLRATTPAGSAGSKSVQVTNPDGQSATLNNAFSQVAPAPTLSSISPSSGSTSGGTVITLTGANFVSGATVRVGSTAATGVTFLSATQLRATTPAAAAGVASVRVTNPDSQLSTLSNAFTYSAAAPSLSSVSPSSGPTTGGTVITLNGTNFGSGATVRVNGTAASGVTLVSATQLRATTPASVAGTASVQVTNPDSQSAALVNAFTYIALTPSLSSVSPNSGSTTGGTVLTLTGANFVPGATVRVGGTAASGVTFLSATQLRATTPAAAAGTVSVQVINPDSQSASLSSAFTYSAAAPSLSAVSPSSGPSAGGTVITLTGANFVSGATVRVGGASATSVTFLGTTQLRATTPAGTAGAASVQVTNPSGQTAALGSGFTYIGPAPSLSSISPTAGPTTGGTLVTLTGANFVSGATVRVGGAAATGVTFLSATQLRAITPSRSVGAADVQVTNPSGQSTTLDDAFTYSAQMPALSSVSPASGPVAGGTVITLSGANFQSGANAAIRVGGVMATGITFVSSTQFRATTPAGASGPVTVQVVNPGGQSASMANGFTYTRSTSDDADGDGLPTAWEEQYGLNPNSAIGLDGATGDPDSDSVVNNDELQLGTHPRGTQHKYLAEGAVNIFFSTRLSIANPQAVEAKVLLTFSDSNGHTSRRFVGVPPRSRRTVNASDVAELAGTSFATALESDQVVVLDRLMTWASRNDYAAHAETAVDRPSTTWYLAEGATGGPFELFYLIQNPSSAAANLQVRYLLPNGRPPLVKHYTVDAGARFTIWVDIEDQALAATDVSAEVTSTNGVPVIVERSMYLNTWRRSFKGGHNSAAVTAPATRWFLAEGSTGSYFSMYVLLANPTGQTATVRATYLRGSGAPIVKEYTVQPNSRFTVDVSTQDPALRDASVAVQVESTNGVPVIVERTMWWPNTGGGWTEGHNAFGTTTTGPRWMLAEGEVGGPRSIETFVLVANTSAAAANVRATVIFESGAEQSRVYEIGSNRRFTVPISSDFPSTAGKRFSVLIESLNPATAGALVVERAMYWNTDDEVWGAGSNAVATRLP